jgi:hypothetical protein
MLDQMLDELGDAIDRHRTQLEERAHTMGSIELTDLAGLLREWSANTKQDLRAQINLQYGTTTTRDAIATAKRDLVAKVSAAAAGATDATRLKQAAGRLPDMAAATVGAAATDVQRNAVDAIRKQVVAATKKLERKLREEFDALTEVVGDVANLPATTIAAGTSTNPAAGTAAGQNLTAFARQLEIKENVAIGGGALAGAAIGSAVVPGIGTVIGLLAGLAIGGSGIEKKRAKFLAHATALIDPMCDETKRRLDADVARALQGGKGAVDATAAAYADHLREPVDELLAHERAQRHELEGALKNSKRLAKTVKARRQAWQTREQTREEG